ncbi:hypothetical protein D3C81_2000680 [compost metagenome]
MIAAMGSIGSKYRAFFAWGIDSPTITIIPAAAQYCTRRSAGPRCCGLLSQAATSTSNASG